MATAVHLRFDTDTRFTANVQRANAFRTIDFMAGEGHQVHLQLAQIDRQLAHALGGVYVVNDTAGATHLADGSDILHHADFVIHMHDGNQDGVVTHRRFQLFEIDNPVALRRQVGHLEAFTLQLTAGIQNRFMLGFAGDDVLAFFLIKVGCTLDRQVVGFSRTRGKDDFARVGTDQLGNLIAGDINRLFSLPAKTVGTGGRVTKGPVHGQELHHFLGNTRVHRRGCGVIEINR